MQWPKYVTELLDNKIVFDWENLHFLYVINVMGMIHVKINMVKIKVLRLDYFPRTSPKVFLLKRAQSLWIATSHKDLPWARFPRWASVFRDKSMDRITSIRTTEKIRHSEIPYFSTWGPFVSETSCEGQYALIRHWFASELNKILRYES